MMGFQGTPARLFFDFCLDEHVPSDHMLRGIDRHLDLADLRQSLKPFYSRIGRPSVDPELMIRMLIVGYSMGIRSERRLCEEVHLKSRLSLVLPARLRESDALRRLFESVVQRCIAEGLVSADRFAQRDQPCREEACKPPQLSPSRMPEFTPKPPIPVCWLCRCEPQPQRAPDTP